jgi:Ca-activated chloride channel family protein
MQDGGRLDGAKTAVGRFVSALPPADRVMLLAIGSEVEEAAPISSDRAMLLKALSAFDAWGTTALHDAIVAGIERIQPERGRRALVILSDGNDRYSRTSAADTIAKARTSDVLVYPIALGKTRPALFAELAVVTGGRSAHAKDPRALEPALTGIANELRSQYLIGYSPARPIASGENRWRTISRQRDATGRARPRTRRIPAR